MHTKRHRNSDAPLTASTIDVTCKFAALDRDVCGGVKAPQVSPVCFTKTDR